MNYEAMQMLLHRLSAVSDIDLRLAVAYSMHVADRIMSLRGQHIGRYEKAYDFSPLWDGAMSAAATDMIAMFGEANKQQMIDATAAIWAKWQEAFNAQLLVSNVPSTRQLLREVDDLIDGLATTRRRMFVLTNDTEKRQFIDMLMSLPV